MSRSDFRWFFKSLFKLLLNWVLLIPRVESFFKGFLILILVHASTEFSKNIWAILILLFFEPGDGGPMEDHLQDLETWCITNFSSEKDEREEKRRPSGRKDDDQGRVKEIDVWRQKVCYVREIWRQAYRIKKFFPPRLHHIRS